MDPPVEDFLVEQMAGGYRTVTTRDEFSGKEVIVVRGAETIEDVFPDWIKQSRLDAHYYIPFDLNMPQTLPKREPLAEAYALDPPLSEYGKLTAQVFARHLQSRGVAHKGTITIYTSPTLACLQTAHEIYHYLRPRCNAIRIDSGLTADCRGFDYWLKEPAIRKIGYFVDWNYKSLQRAERSETIYTIEERVIEAVRGIEMDQDRHCVVLVTDALALSMINRRVRRLPLPFSEDIFTEKTRDEFSGKEVIVVRGAETIEDVFPDWIKQSRLDAHYYIPFDLNMPQTLPKREPLAEAYALDPPLSEYGKLTAQVFARHLQSRGVAHKGTITIYTSPTLACLQTAHEIYHYLRPRCNAIRIDSGLTADCRGFDYWLKEPAIRKIGYFVDWNYKSLQRAERSETIYTIEERVIEAVRGIEIDQDSHCVVLVTDALALSMINRRVRRLPLHFSEDIFTEKIRADVTVPPNSSLVFLPDCGFHQFLPRHLHPLTDSSGTLRVDLDDGVDFLKAG